jgi:hypothetical protein
MLAIMLGTAFISTASAQGPSTSTEEVVLHVKDLTSAERDALQRDLANSGGVELAYACVPAGILVLHTTVATDRTAIRDQVMTLVAGRTSTARVKELPLDQAQAEERCAAARGR